MDDSELLVRWREGDRKAGQTLCNAYLPAISRFFKNKSRGDIGDLVQQTFLALASAKDRFEGRSSVRAFVFGIARNVLYSHYRARTKARLSDELDEAQMRRMDENHRPGIETLLGGRADEELLLAALRQLTIEDQLIMELFYWEGCTAAEVGEVIGMKENSVRNRLNRGRAKLAKRVEELTQDPSLRVATMTGLDTWADRVRANAREGREV